MLGNFALFLLRFTVKGNKNNAKSLLSAHVLSKFPGLNDTLRKNYSQKPSHVVFSITSTHIGLVSRQSHISLLSGIKSCQPHIVRSV